MEKEIILDKRDKCKDCKGTGAEGGGKVITCPKCHGQGQIRTTRRTIFGNIASAAICEIAKVQVKCRKSRVDLRRKRNLRRKTLSVKIPAGIGDGQSIRVSGEAKPATAAQAPDCFARARPAAQRICA